MSGGGGGPAAAPGGLADVYSEMILDHNRRPRNFGRLPGASHSAAGNNPLCGDHVAVYLRLLGDRIEEIAFDGAGCAISTASASIMTEMLRGRSPAEARRLFESFHSLLTGREVAAEGGAELGKLEAFAGVREYPMRVKCATLAWHALVEALGSPLTGGQGGPGGQTASGSRGADERESERQEEDPQQEQETEKEGAAT